MTTKFTRLEALKGGLASLGALYLAGCGGGGSGGGGGAAAVDVLEDWLYIGQPGSMAKFWKESRSALATADAGATLGNFTEVPYEALYEATTAQFRAKSGATLITFYPDYPCYQRVHSKEIVALDDLVSPGETDHWLLASSRYDGKFWAAPMVMELVVLGVNRKHLDKAGVEVGDRFESYDAFIEACDRLKAAGITPIQVGSADGLQADHWGILEQMQVAESPAEPLRVIAGEESIELPFFKRTLEQLATLRDKYMNEHPDADNQTQAAAKFLKGSGGMCMVYPAQIFADGVGGEFDVVGFPASDAKFNRPAAGTGDALWITAHADNQAEAGKIIDFLHKPEQLNRLYELTGELPADDRFEASVLPEKQKRLWDFINDGKADGFSLWFPDSFYPLGPGNDYFLGIEPQVVAGLSSEEAMKKADQSFTRFREQNPEELETVKDFIKVLDGELA